MTLDPQSMLQCVYCQTQNSSFNPFCKSCGKDLPLDHWPAPQASPAMRSVDTEEFGLLPPGASLPHNLGRYTLVGFLARGLDTEVYQAEDEMIRRKVAIKAFPQLGDIQTTKQSQFLKEARALALLNHPHVAQIYDVIQVGKIPCLVMEWVAGEAIVQTAVEGRFEAMTIQAVAALNAAHNCGLIHRDLKPDHILVTDHGIKLIDFGLVKRFGEAVDSLSSTSKAESWRGSPAYMAPEQVKGEVLDWRADQFSLALIWSEWLLGRHPFAANNLAIVLHHICFGEPQFKTGDQHKVSPRQEKVLRRALSKSPSDRWPTLLEFQKQLLTT